MLHHPHNNCCTAFLILNLVLTNGCFPLVDYALGDSGALANYFLGMKDNVSVESMNAVLGNGEMLQRLSRCFKFQLRVFYMSVICGSFFDNTSLIFYDLPYITEHKSPQIIGPFSQSFLTFWFFMMLKDLNALNPIKIDSPHQEQFTHVLSSLKLHMIAGYPLMLSAVTANLLHIVSMTDHDK